MNRIPFLAVAAAAALLPGAVLAQAPAPAPAASAGGTVAAGATVYDTAGGVVGTIASTDGTNAVVDTGSVKAAIPLASLGKGAKGPVLAMTKAELETAAGAQQAQASAAFQAKLVPGAAVYGTGGAQLGTIKAVDATGVTLTTSNGEAKLPANGFGPGPQGVTVGLTAAQLSAAMGAAGGSANASSGSTTSTTTGAAPATPGTTSDASTTAPGATTTTTPPTGKSKKPKSR